MRFSVDGKPLNTDTLGTNAMDWGWLDKDTAIGYRYDVTPNGLYTFSTVTGKFTFLGDYQSAIRVRFYAASGAWLVDLTTGPLDSNGTRWDGETNSACGMGDQGERIFVRKPDFSALVIEGSVINAPGFHNSSPVTLKQGFLMYDGGGGPTDRDGNVVGPHGAMQTFTIAPDGQKWCVGYVGGWGLGLWKWGSMRGYCLSTDLDFYPDVVALSSSRLRVGSSGTQGDTILKIYDVDLAMRQFMFRERWQPLVEVDFSQPPVDQTPFTAWEGPFFASSNRYGSATTPGNCEVLLQGTYDLLEVKRPVLAGVGEAASVPDSQLIGVFWQADPATYAQALAYAKHRKRPLYVYSDTNVYPDEVIQNYCTWSGAIPLVQAYPARKEPGEPLKASPQNRT